MTADMPFALNTVLQELSDLARFRARAVIDWVDIEVETQSPTNFHTVQDRVGAILGAGRKTWVEAVGKGPGGTATRFVIRLHDVPCYSDLASWITSLSARLPLTAYKRLRQIEVAVDFYSRRGDRKELEALTLRLKHHVNAYGYKELESGPSTERVENTWRLRPDRTLVIEQAEICWRVYLKDRDKGSPILNVAEHRARIEVRLSDAQPSSRIPSFQDLKSYRFQGLASLFAFRRLVPDESFTAVPTTAAELAQKRPLELALRRGIRELPLPSRQSRRKHSPITRADGLLKERCRQALRDLTRRVGA
jgi:hypothetical protein